MLAPSVAVPVGEDLLELLLFPLLLVPLGEGLLWLLEQARGAGLGLSWVERGILAFYAAGAVFYLLAYLPIGLLTRSGAAEALLVGAAAGWLLWGWRATHRLGRGSWATALTVPTGGSTDAALTWPRFVRSPYLPLFLLFLFVLAFEVLVVGSEPSPNTYDGSIQAMYATLLLAHGSAPLSLQPIAPMGVIYPQGTAVWMGVASALFGWPTVLAPTLLPPLFMALSVPAAYAWGARAFGREAGRAARGGLVFAASTALLVSWPRFLVGGSYDFLFSLPLFFLALGWLSDRRTRTPLVWDDVLLLGLGLGVMASLSPVPVEFFLALLLVTELARPGVGWGNGAAWAGRTAVVAGLAALFELPSLVGISRWWSYPGHVLTPTGGPYVFHASTASALGTFVGLVDPFLFRPLDVWLSPFDLLKGELAILLAAGLFLVVLRFAGSEGLPFRYVPKRVGRHLLSGVLIGVLVVLVLELGAAASPTFKSVSELTSAPELSILLFVFYGAFAALPMVAAAEDLRRRFRPSAASVPVASAQEGAVAARLTRARRRAQVRASRSGAFPGHPVIDRSALLGVVSLLVLAFPLGSGAAVTLLQAPAYLETGILDKLANVTPDDLAMLQWAAGSLPSCSSVLVAPGSAGVFLASYDPSIRLLYPMDPMPRNYSYQHAVAELQAGNYTSSVRADLLALEATEVVVTGQSNVLWEPFELTAFLGSGDFVLLYPSAASGAGLGVPGGDAYVFEFVPGVQAYACPP